MWAIAWPSSSSPPCIIIIVIIITNITIIIIIIIMHIYYDNSITSAFGPRHGRLVVTAVLIAGIAAHRRRRCAHPA